MGVVFGKQTVAEPAYDVLMTHSKQFSYEIRKYGQRFAAETRSSGEDNDQSFRLLAQYIGVFGTPENSAKESIAMTAPVVMEDHPTKIAMTAPVIQTDSSSDKNGERVMQFILPAEFDDMSKIPKPTNDKVTIQSIPPASGAVHRYAGTYSRDAARDKAKQLCQQLRADGLDIAEDFVLKNYQMWAYNPPFTIPLFRRNEIWIELTDAQVDQLVNGFQASQAN